MLLTLLYFLLALFVLVIVHEYGHFLVARCCGVKVLRFSFGFGKVLASWRDKKGTEYAWSLFPLGGYVKMLDETEDAVPPQERHLAFNNKSIWVRIAVVLAGPLFNFIFAFVALWLVLIIGIKSLAPIVSEVKPESIAARAGISANQEIIALDNHKIASWRDFQYALMPHVGTNESIRLTLKSLKNGQEKTVILSLMNWHLNAKNPDVLGSFGIVPFVPTVPMIVGEVVANSPAESAGLQVGDKITSVDGHALADWFMLVDFVKHRPNQTLQMHITRAAEQKTIAVHLGHDMANGHIEGYLGVRSQRLDWPANWLRLQRERPIPAIATAFKQTIDLTGTTFALIGRLITGKISLQSISGPVGIAEGAGSSARIGLSYYLSFLALVSISLGVLNLLPIPMLDGGHFLYYLLELIRRRPASEGFRTVGMYLGMILLAALMIVALSNDISRLAS